ncbi:uncharacterized protein LY79DRAFT_553771 [Colletotrichum navitas]|uniref:Uncharacterized protein n=1 Tax=Colletotrichum navitas TaxID=681940 RepID=A0AAD8V3D6_9PEZI|nr:uncharacterized protein LY79DRAFT_553771 [Colletotrichum navitas]KAK1590700.1 hypothetical protein LY79DRAFT_553771 [Colletotrichum navitas]
MRERAGSWRSRATCVCSASLGLWSGPTINVWWLASCRITRRQAALRIDKMKKQPDTPASRAAGTQNAIGSAAPNGESKSSAGPRDLRHDTTSLGTRTRKRSACRQAQRMCHWFLVTQLYLAQHCRPFRFVRLFLFAPHLGPLSDVWWVPDVCYRGNTAFLALGGPLQLT